MRMLGQQSVHGRYQPSPHLPMSFLLSDSDEIYWASTSAFIQQFRILSHFDLFLLDEVSCTYFSVGAEVVGCPNPRFPWPLQGDIILSLYDTLQTPEDGESTDISKKVHLHWSVQPLEALPFTIIQRSIPHPQDHHLPFGISISVEDKPLRRMRI